jgi:hypothetical protein
MPLERLPFRLDLVEIGVKAEHDFLSLALWHGRHLPLTIKRFLPGGFAI